MNTSTTITRRTRRSEQEWRVVMARFDRSGLGAEALCAREGIALGTFSNWRSRLGRRTAGPKPAPVAPSPFVELVGERSKHEFDIELDLGRGVVLRMRSR